MAPLAGLRVIDFSTLLPGPLASLILAESGADVLKVERPGIGDESRALSPVLFAMLNRGKRSLSADLGSAAGRAAVLDLVRDADVLIEQFRPGVMSRLGLGWDEARALNPRLIYCSITGYGQTGPLAAAAGHDLNYQAETGLLAGCQGMPHILAADIMGGAYPAALNILLALAARERDGQGRHLDVAMAENVFTAMPVQLAELAGAGHGGIPGGFFMGKSPRYRTYRTRDGRFMAVGAVEDRFWDQLCEAVGLPPDLRDDRRTPEATARALSELFGSRDAADWCGLLAGRDVCCNLVADPEQALASAHFDQRGVFSRQVLGPDGKGPWPALPLPVAEGLRRGGGALAAPALGRDDGRGWFGNV